MTYMYTIPYALLVVPQLPNRWRTCTLFLNTHEIIPRLNYFISLSFQGGQMAVCVFIVAVRYFNGRKLIYHL